MKSMIGKHPTFGSGKEYEPFAFWLVRQFLSSPDEELEDLKPVDDKEFYSILGMLLAGLAAIALTIGPFAIR